MHVFMLIIQLAGHPEHAVAICDSYKACSDEGQETQQRYIAEHHLRPTDFLFRVIPVLIVPDDPT